jgi:universal stress protein A
MRLQTILVPIDFSSFSEQALQWALGIATARQAKIILVHAVHPLAHLAFPESVCITDFPTIERELKREAKKQLDHVAAQTIPSPPVPVTTQVVMGNPVWEICQAATREQVDLVVMGSRGRTGLSYILLGSVAERVMRHAPCPVLVVRSAQAASG